MTSIGAARFAQHNFQAVTSKFRPDGPQSGAEFALVADADAT
jgi:hypothetical protein